MMTDVQHLVYAFDTNPSVFKGRASAPKRATKGFKTPVASQRRSRWLNSANV